MQVLIISSLVILSVVSIVGASVICSAINTFDLFY